MDKCVRHLKCRFQLEQLANPSCNRREEAKTIVQIKPTSVIKWRKTLEPHYIDPELYDLYYKVIGAEIAWLVQFK